MKNKIIAMPYSMIQRIALIFALLFIFPAVAHAWPAKVIQVTDGDTLVVIRMHNGEPVLDEKGQPIKEKIRLFGVDCPESAFTGRWEAQPYSRRATDFVKAVFADARQVDVAIWETGTSYGRIVGGVITLHDGHTLQERLVEEGLAWVAWEADNPDGQRYCNPRTRPQCKQWLQLQEQAQAEKRGLWRDNNPIPPWQWRHMEDDE